MKFTYLHQSSRWFSSLRMRNKILSVWVILAVLSVLTNSPHETLVMILLGAFLNVVVWVIVLYLLFAAVDWFVKQRKK